MAGKQLFSLSRDVLSLHQKGQGLTACVQRVLYDLQAFRNEDPVFGIPPVFQLCLRQPGIDIQLRGGQVGDLNNIGHIQLL